MSENDCTGGPRIAQIQIVLFEISTKLPIDIVRFLKAKISIFDNNWTLESELQNTCGFLIVQFPIVPNFALFEDPI